MQQRIINRTMLHLIILSFAFSIVSCKKFIEVKPPKTELVRATVFENDATATSAVLGIYEQMLENIGSFSNGGLTLYAGLSSDEMFPATNILYEQFYNNALSSLNNQIRNILWANPYTSIYQANSVIEGLASSQKVTLPIKSQLEGEARFIRAFYHFYLLNLFGDIPLITTTDYRRNASTSRTDKEQVYQQIVADLQAAHDLLTDNYVKPDNTTTTDKVRPNKWVVKAMLARIYLYRSDWANAELQASAIISNVSKYNMAADLNTIFLKNSTEAIWQLMPVSTGGINTAEGFMFIPQSSLPPVYSSLNDELVNSFESGDARKTSWIQSYVSAGQTYFYPYKYKVRVATGGSAATEYYMVFRLAEQFLIRSEARARLNDFTGALSDLNVIRNRAGLGDLPSSLTQSEILLAIEKERRAELFSEWGHRWFDLKRTNRADVVLEIIKAPGWQSTDVLYPIPQYEIDNNPNLTQNSGY